MEGQEEIENPHGLVFVERTNEEIRAELERQFKVIGPALKRFREGQRLPQGWRDWEITI